MNISFKKLQKCVSKPSPHCLEYSSGDSFILSYEAPEVLTSHKGLKAHTKGQMGPDGSLLH